MPIIIIERYCGPCQDHKPGNYKNWPVWLFLGVWFHRGAPIAMVGQSSIGQLAHSQNDHDCFGNSHNLPLPGRRYHLLRLLSPGSFPGITGLNHKLRGLLDRAACGVCAIIPRGPTFWLRMRRSQSRRCSSVRWMAFAPSFTRPHSGFGNPAKPYKFSITVRHDTTDLCHIIKRIDS